MNLSKSYQELISCCNHRIMILDGGFAAALGQLNLTEKDFRGKMFADHFVDLKGDNDVLSLTAPDKVKDVHLAYLDAGADLIEANTFGATSFGQAKYRLQHMAYDIAKAGAQVAKTAVQEFNDKCLALGKMVMPKFVVGALGPVSNCTPQPATFAQVAEAYGEQVRGLLDGGADVLLIDTSDNTLDCKAALNAICKECEKRGELFPIIVLGALWHSVSSFPIFSIGFNCGSGEAQLRHLRDLTDAYVRVSVCPDALEDMELWSRRFAEEPLANIVGGGSGCTPETLRLLARAVAGRTPRKVPARKHDLLLSGRDPMVVNRDSRLVNIGASMNMAGSAKFARLIREGRYEEALALGKANLGENVQIVGVNLDDGLIDSREAMTRFLSSLKADSSVAGRPLMIGSCRWDVLLAGMECVQGKGIVNSISLEEGEESFLAKASEIRHHGFAVVCKAVDERGWASTFERRVEIIERMYRLLVGRLDFLPEDILFDPNIYPLGATIENCPDAAKDFMEVCRHVRENLPHAHLVGDLFFLSLPFRGDRSLQDCIQSVFLHHAKYAGMDFAVVQSGTLPAYEEVPYELRRFIGDLLFNRHSSAIDNLLDYEARKRGVADGAAAQAWRESPAEERIRYALLNGQGQFVVDDLKEILDGGVEPLQAVRGPLMETMTEVYRLFAEGKLFFPQVEKSVMVLAQAVSVLRSAIESERQNAAAPSARVVLASVDFGIHDIGKEILAEFFPCFGFTVTDLGIGCSCEKIVEEVYREQPDVVWLSGLFVSSLDKMVGVAREFKSQGIEIPLVLGGVSTSAMHTAVKVAPEAVGPVVYASDPGKSVMVAEALIDTSKRGPFFEALKKHQDKLRAKS